MAIQKRGHAFVDADVQGTLLRRVVFYWVVCVLGILVILSGFPIIACRLGMQDPPSAIELVSRTLVQFWPALVTCFLVLLFVLMDFVRVSHRFVGPVLRMRTAVQKLADGEKIDPLEFRKDDFWSGFAEDFNRLAKKIEGNAESVEKV